MFLRKKQKLLIESNAKLNELVHFIRTPLTSIKIGTEIIRDTFSDLIEIDESLSKKEASINSISEAKFKNLLSVLNNILIESERISEYINAIEKSKF